MKKQSARELGREIPDNIRLLSKLIARKPAEYTPEWASEVNQAFSSYTRTSTINLLSSLNQGLIERGWPFPSFLDLKHEIEVGLRGLKITRWGRSIRWQHRPNLFYVLFAGADKEEAERTRLIDGAMVSLFDANKTQIFGSLSRSEVLSSKGILIHDIEAAYKRNLWSVCITAVMPVLDFVMRLYLGTTRLDTGIQTIRTAVFERARLRSKDFMPGHAVFQGSRDPNSGNAFAKSLEEDLRLPGVYLASFLEFADRYYRWYKAADLLPSTSLNRHAVVHCASEYWTHANSARILTFLHLLVRLDTILKILIHGKDGLDI